MECTGLMFVHFPFAGKGRTLTMPVDLRVGSTAVSIAVIIVISLLFDTAVSRSESTFRQLRKRD